MFLQRQQKQRQLLGRLQDLLLGPKADEQTTCEVLDYFLRRLGSSQVASRVLAMKVSPQRRPPPLPSLAPPSGGGEGGAGTCSEPADLRSGTAALLLSPLL